MMKTMSSPISLTPTRVAVLSLCFGVLQGCGSYSDIDAKVNYKSQSAVKTTPLDVPPDLTQLGRDTKYNIPGTAVSANGLNNKPVAAPQQVIAPKQINDVRLARDGARRWLVVDRPAEVVWPIVDEFWKENGFTYVIEQKDLGILETEWAENRAKIPMDFIRRTLGKVLDGAYDSGQRDKYRTRIERNDNGGVDIYITQRGMSEEFADQSKIRTIWMPRPSDPELEAEFMARLMVKLGMSSDAAKAAVAQATPQAPADAATQSPNQLTLKDSFDVAWRRVGLALDRTGFTVEDRDRAQGIYFVRYVETAKKEDPGFFKKLFSSSKPDTGPQKFRVVVANANGTSTVTIQNSEGKPDQGEIAQRILKLLAGDLN
jgi:outer membrane protein assembly factor BamC